MAINSLRSITKRLDDLEARCGPRKIIAVFDQAEASALERAGRISANALVVITGVPRPAAVGA